MSGSNALLELHGISVDYVRARNRLTAIADITLTIGSAEFIAIVGPSGCGKSTLLKALSGLLPLAGGTLTWAGAGVDAAGREPDARPSSALVFQSPRLLLWRTVLDNVAFGLEARGSTRRAARAKGLALLERVGLAEFAGSFPRQLSGGMQQRVNLARALGVDPDLILLDEPFAALDAQTREAMQAYLNRVWFGEDKTALLVTHQVDEAVYLADRVIVLSARPATVLLDVPVLFERPRDLRIKRDPQFRAIEDHIWDALEQTVGATDDLAGGRVGAGA
jgi:NitT/TauT family transport system ATP-binding protein